MWVCDRGDDVRWLMQTGHLPTRKLSIYCHRTMSCRCQGDPDLDSDKVIPYADEPLREDSAAYLRVLSQC